jgi:hypothetical protein
MNDKNKCLKSVVSLYELILYRDLKQKRKKKKSKFQNDGTNVKRREKFKS